MGRCRRCDARDRELEADLALTGIERKRCSPLPSGSPGPGTSAAPASVVMNGRPPSPATATALSASAERSPAAMQITRVRMRINPLLSPDCGYRLTNSGAAVFKWQPRILPGSATADKQASNLAERRSRLSHVGTRGRFRVEGPVAAFAPRLALVRRDFPLPYRCARLLRRRPIAGPCRNHREVRGDDPSSRATCGSRSASRQLGLSRPLSPLQRCRQHLATRLYRLPSALSHRRGIRVTADSP
jgi:hypothetical protein